MKKKHPIKLIAFSIITVIAISAMSCRQTQRATINEKLEIIKTYPFSEPDPIPILTRSSLWGRGARLYPYYFFDKFSKDGMDKEWKVVRLENPYIGLSILPQVGGKIWGAVEKSTNKEFIYTNHVLKFREIALRGPWTSGGIEFNFGIVGHTPACATPVDYLIRENSDGSVSCVIGAMDIPSRTRWSVTISLPEEKAFFETHSFWYNPSPFHQSYYSWMNSAAKTGDDLQFIFPGRFHIGHNYSVPLKPWPANKQGRNLSWYKNNNFGSYKSYFTVGEYENFFGGYWHDSEFGFGHWALYDDVPGHKLWLWSLSRQGAIWENLLTDSDGQYSEPQAGRLLNQSDHEFFTPYSADLWREIWFPYKKIGPMIKASPLGVLNVTQDGDTIIMGICPLQKIDDDLEITGDGKEIYREHIELEPMEIFEKKIPVTQKFSNFQVKISNRLFYSSNPQANDLHRPIHFHKFDDDSAEGLYLKADRYMKERNYYMALETYLACLEKESFHTDALCRVAELYYRRGEYKKALAYAHKALENVMYDPEANYIYGIISRRLGNLVDAKETLGWAARSMKYRSAAYCQMAEICFLEKNLDLTLEYAQRAMDFNKFNINAYQIMALAYRKIGKPEKAQQLLSKLLKIEPLNHLARFEHYLLKPTQKNLKNFQSMIRNELPHENYLEMALYYVKLGLDHDAVELLKNAPEYSTVYYWLAYLLKDEAPQESHPYLNKAQSLSPRLVFPFREESIPVFQWAIKNRSEDWKTQYYLGLIYWSKGRVQEARELLDSCGNPDFAPFYHSRAHLYKDVNLKKALVDYEKALNIDRKSMKNWHHLISYYNELGLFVKSLSLAREAFSTFPDDGIIRIDLIRSLIKNNLYKESLEMLENTVALPFEGATEIHGLFVRCQIELSLKNMKEGNYNRAIDYLEGSKRYPENLGTGKPYNPDYRLQDYLIALCYDRVGEKEKAEERRKIIYDYTLKHWDEQRRNQYIGGLILQYFGDHEKARQLMKKEKPSKGLLETIRRMSQR